MTRALGTRSSGVLLHPTSLPGRFGIGDLGPEAHAFAGQLAAARQRIWQVLPLGPTGYGDSPYQGLSAFAGNPLLVSLDVLLQEGWLQSSDVEADVVFGDGPIDYRAVVAHRRQVWPVLLDRFESRAPAAWRDRFERFCVEQASWLDDFALYMALKAAHHDGPWTAWPGDIARREPHAVARWRAREARTIRMHQLLQFVFFDQWGRLRDGCDRLGIGLLGDLPIFVAHDSADVWAHRELFRLDDAGAPEVLTGVPPDYFSATGQLWGNPHYRWDVLAADGFAWWIERVRAALALVDGIRIDHFRGFEAAWEVPGGASTAIDGVWRSGPGAALFEAMQRALGLPTLPFVAENLGIITPEVEALRERFALPGMAILQFAFGRDPQATTFKPHNFSRRTVVYTGTHDNDTTVGWWNGQDDHSTRSETDVVEERARATAYLGLDATGDRMVHWAFIRAALASVAQTAIVPVQDLLGLGGEARMNRPGTSSGNWRWRLRPGELTPGMVERLGMLTEVYERG